MIYGKQIIYSDEVFGILRHAYR